MTQFLDFNLSQAYNEIKENAEAEPVTSKEAWNDMVEVYINDKIDSGELDKDEDYEAMIEELKSMWGEYEKNLNIR
ncbi:MAG: hypothetical protein NTX82_01400 [Candidatus Parcubacteria bacterium]|nr:hypothetical protein [Candidatus Parcubacteria bacterium]